MATKAKEKAPAKAPAQGAVELSTIKSNPNNPRVIRDDKFEKLKKSIQEFPKMLAIRPLVLDENNVVLGGNMRLKALQELGFKTIPNNWVLRAADLTAEEKKRFIIEDNVAFGAWNWDAILQDWKDSPVADWGLDVPQFEEAIDYSILDEADKEKVESLEAGVKKAIQIEFKDNHYPIAFELVAFFRERGDYVGGILIDHLTALKEKVQKEPAK